MQISKVTVEGFTVKLEPTGPVADIKLRCRPTAEDVADLYGLLLQADLTLDLEIRSKQGAFA